MVLVEGCGGFVLGIDDQCKNAQWTASSSMAGPTTIILAGALTHQNCYRS
jgi:hypothetical protein